MRYPVGYAHCDYVSVVGGVDVKYRLFDLMDMIHRDVRMSGYKGFVPVAGGRYRGEGVETDIGSIAWGGRPDGTRQEGEEFCVQISGYIAHMAKSWFDANLIGDGGHYSRIDHALTVEGRLNHIWERDRLRGYIKEDAQHHGTVYRGVRKSDRLTRTYQKGGGHIRLELQWNKKIAVANWKIPSSEAIAGEIEGVRGRRWYKGSVWDRFSDVLEGVEGVRPHIGEPEESGYDGWLNGVISHLLTRPESAQKVRLAIGGGSVLE